MIPVKSLSMWMATVNPRKVGADVRTKLERYQVEAADVLNLARRSYTPDQRAALAEEFRAAQQEQMRERQQRGLKRGPERPGSRVVENNDTEKTDTRIMTAEKFGVTQNAVAEAHRIRKADPQVFEAVKSGDLTIRQAKACLAPAPAPAADPDTEEAVPAPVVEPAPYVDGRPRL